MPFGFHLADSTYDQALRVSDATTDEILEADGSLHDQAPGM
jgi:hypothetical protein